MSEIELPLGQTAQPGKCGSCHFFGRRNESLAGIPPANVHLYNNGGYCTLELPPQYARREQGEGAPTNWINDTGSCDLWKSSGHAYIERRRVAA